MRASNSAERSPSNTRCVWESTQPGSTARPPTDTRSSASGASAAGPIQAMRSSSTTTAASVSTRPSGSTVVSSAMSVMSVERMGTSLRDGRGWGGGVGLR